MSANIIGCGSSIYRRNSEWHLFDDSGTAGVITDGSANVLSNNLYDAFGVLMYASGSAATPWRFEGRFVEEEGLVASAGGGGDVLVARGVAIAAKPAPKKLRGPCTARANFEDCLSCCDDRYAAAVGACERQLKACLKHAHNHAARAHCKRARSGCLGSASSDWGDCTIACAVHYTHPPIHPPAGGHWPIFI